MKNTGPGAKCLRGESPLALGSVTSPGPRVVLGHGKTELWALTAARLRHKTVHLTPFPPGLRRHAWFQGQLAFLSGCPEALVRDPALLRSLPWSFVVSGEISLYKIVLDFISGDILGALWRPLHT